MDSHVVSARRRGLTDAEIEAIATPERWPDVFDARSQTALRLADALAGPATAALEPALQDELRSLFVEREIAELILVAGQANLNNRVGNAAKQLLGRSVER